MHKDEIIDVVDEDGKVIKTIPRAQAERENHLTPNVLIFLFNSEGKVWVQLRPTTKSHYPAMWDISACGGVASGEAVDQAALRETKEETGIDAELHHVETFLNVMDGDNGEERKRLSHLYIGFSDDTPRPNEEVDEFKSWSPSELRTDALKHPEKYVPTIITELDKAVAAYKQIRG